MNTVLERVLAADEAVREHYGTPAGNAIVLAHRFGLPLAAISPLKEAEMWRRLIAARAARKAKVEEEVPSAVPITPSRRAIDAGLRFARCPIGEMPKSALDMRDAARAAGWTAACTRWIGMIPTRKNKDQPWGWKREHRVALWLDGPTGRRAVGHWTDGRWSSGWTWMPGELRQAIGARALASMVKEAS